MTSDRIEGSDAGPPLRVLLLSWRDGGHPEAGGAEAFLENVSRGLAERGHEVTVLTAHYAGAQAREVRDGRTFLRRGGRFSVYPRTAVELLRHSGRFDVVIDVQNGVPFWAPLVTGVPVVNLVHHIHREQWPEVFGPLRARFGWWLESRLAPRVYRRCRYLVVSQATRNELVALGVDKDQVEVTYSGREPVPDIGELQRSAAPTLVSLGRLVPHKRVELAIRALAELRERHPGLTLQIVGQGYWRNELEQCARDLGVSDAVTFTGFVDELDKHRVLATSWVHLLPSLKEGWGLAIVEAGAQATPSVAFRDASGTTESVLDGETGLLVDDENGFVQAIDRLLTDEQLRLRMGKAAQEFAAGFSWATTTCDVESMLYRVVGQAGGADARERRPQRGAQRAS